jgi:hypothetical protein
MKDDADALSGHMNKLLELTELAQHAGPEDLARIERSIQLVSRAITGRIQVWKETPEPFSA